MFRIPVQRIVAVIRVASWCMCGVSADAPPSITLLSLSTPPCASNLNCRMASRTNSGERGQINSDAMDYDITMDTGGLIGTILNNNLSKSELANKTEADFDLQKLPDASSRLFDTTLRTLLNG